jgi:hypothetical protein
VQQGDEKGLGGGIDVGNRQYPSLLHALQQGLHSGSIQNTSEQFACRFVCDFLRQAVGNLAAQSSPVKAGDALRAGQRKSEEPKSERRPKSELRFLSLPGEFEYADQLHRHG